MTLGLGTPAVAFSLPSTTGTVRLDDLLGRPFLLSFYSMAFTPA